MNASVRLTTPASTARWVNIYSVSQKFPLRPAVFDIFSQTVENFKAIFYIPIIRFYIR